MVIHKFMLQHKCTNVATKLKVFTSAADPGWVKNECFGIILKIFYMNAHSWKWIELVAQIRNFFFRHCSLFCRPQSFIRNGISKRLHNYSFYHTLLLVSIQFDTV